MEIAAVSLGDAAIAGVALILGAYEFWLFARRPRERQHLWVALISFSAAGFSILILILIHYNVGREWAVLLSKLEFFGITLILIWSLLIVVEVLGRWKPILLAAIFLGDVLPDGTGGVLRLWFFV